MGQPAGLKRLSFILRVEGRVVKRNERLRQLGRVSSHLDGQEKKNAKQYERVYDPPSASCSPLGWGRDQAVAGRWSAATANYYAALTMRVDGNGTCGDVAGLGRWIPNRRLKVFISLEPPVHHVPFVHFGFKYKQVRQGGPSVSR